MLAAVCSLEFLGEVAARCCGGLSTRHSLLFATLSVPVSEAILVVRGGHGVCGRLQSGSNREDRLILDPWRTGFIITYALSETLALFGRILRFTGSSVQASVPLLSRPGLALPLYFFWPRPPSSAPDFLHEYMISINEARRAAGMLRLLLCFLSGRHEGRSARGFPPP